MKNRVLSVLLAVLLVLPILPVWMLPAFADDITSSTTQLTDGKTYNVTSDVTVSERIVVSGSVTLVLGGGKTLTADRGIEVASGNTLTIRGSGSLAAIGANYNGEYRAAIGSGYSTGDIIIEGGNITATGCQNAAGIGGGSHSSAGGSVTIKGGTVNATGGTNAAGIGGGSNHNWAGSYGSFGAITISGGSVTATGNGGGAGIGAGGSSSNGAGNAPAITISGGSVTATGGSEGYGIGPGVCTGNSANNGAGGSVVFGAVGHLRFSSVKGSSVVVSDGVVLTDGVNTYSGTLTDAQIGAMAGADLSAVDNSTGITVDGTEYKVYAGFTATNGTTGYNNQGYANLVDNNLNTKYCVGNTTPFVEFYTEGDGFIPYGYILTTAEDTARYPGRNPNSWTVYGKVNSGDSWTVLDYVGSDTTLQGVNKKDYVFPIDYDGTGAPPLTVYRYFRFEVSSIKSGSTFQMMELRFYGEDAIPEYIEARPATCTEYGISQNCYRRLSDGAYFADEACTQPLAESDVIIPATGHTLIFHEATPPAGAQYGIEAYYECSVCHRMFSDAACLTELPEIPVVHYTSVLIDGVEYNLYAGFTKTAASGGFVNEGPEKLIDNDLTTKFCTNTIPLYVEFSAVRGFVPYGYILTTGNDTDENPGRNPKNWTIKAKVNEGDDWTVLTVVQNDTVLQAESTSDYSFTISYAGATAPDPALFKYFRFEVSSVRSENVFQLSELRFYGKQYGVKYVEIKPSNCIETGIAQNCYYCSNGSYYADEACTQLLDPADVVVPLSGHDPVLHAAVPCTATENGTIAYYECNVCHKMFSDQACTHELTERDIIVYRSIDYLNASGVKATAASGTFSVVNSDMQSFSNGWYVVMENVTIDRRVDVTGTVNLILCDGKTLTVNGGLNVFSGNTLNVFAQSTGESKGALNASSNTEGFAGIGGNTATVNAGSISIYGGKITVNGNRLAAGIGGGYPGGGCDVLIAGGEVTANATTPRYFGGAGIGGGSTFMSGVNASRVRITISGGTVTAIAGGMAAGIGCGSNCGATEDSEIKITGGTVTATGGQVSIYAGIGIGTGSGRYPIDGIAIIISGGTVTASGSAGAIGSAGSNGGGVTITGGKINANGGIVCETNGAGAFNFYFNLNFGSTDDYLDCNGSILAASYTLTGTYLIEKDGYAYQATNETVRDGGKITRFNGSFHNVSFYDSDGTTFLASQTIATGYCAKDPNIDLFKMGYRFAYWSYNGAEYDFSSPVSRDLRIVAHYTALSPVTYINSSGSSAATSSYALIENKNGDLTLPAGIYTVESDVTVTGRIHLTGDTIFILRNNKTLNVNGGVGLSSASSLAICRQATSGTDQPGTLNSGSNIAFTENPANSGKKIAIYGGTVNAKGEHGCAAIGGVLSVSANVLIAGGTVTATARGNQGCAIGTGFSASGGTITITGGTVYADGDPNSSSTGIGSTDYGTGCTIEITGGTVYAAGYDCGPAIGMSSVNYSYMFSCTIRITGGKVIAGNGGIGGGNGSASIKLGTTNASDFIYSPGYNGSVTFNNALRLKGVNPEVYATASNIAGQTLVGANVHDCTVRFYEEDGTTLIATRMVFPGDTITYVPAAPQVFGKVFEAWTNNGAQFDMSSIITGDLSLKASYFVIPAPSGSGTASDPYKIYTTADWNLFADMVNVYDMSLGGCYVKLCSNDVTVTKMVGTSETGFAGSFDGDGHTIALDITSDQQMAAPFSRVEGATIKNLHTVGTVRSFAYHASGLVGVSYGVTIVNCRVSASILFYASMTTVHSGSFIGHAMSSPFTMKGCLFDGTIGYDGTSSKTMTNVGGLVGWDDASTPTIVDCVNAGTFVNPGDIAPIARVNGRGTITNCYTFIESSCSGSNIDRRGSFAYSISAGDGATLSVTAVTVYAVSGITALEHGIRYGGIVYAGSGETVTLDLTDDTASGFGFETNAGTLTQVSGDTYKLVMPAQNVVITPSAYLFGDINQDGYVTIFDVTALLDYLTLNSVYVVVYDLSGDHMVSIADVTTLLDLLAGK